MYKIINIKNMNLFYEKNIKNIINKYYNDIEIIYKN